MVNLYLKANVYVQVLIATFMTFSVTALGAAIVFIFKKVNKNLLDAMLGLSAGVMIAASFWSLLEPAISDAEKLEMNAWLITSIGFLSGSLFLIISDKIFDKLLVKKNHHKNNHMIKRSLMLIFSITLHNIPEGLAVGVAFGSIALGVSGASVTSAFMLAVGIAIQNFPEGCAVSLPLRRENY